MLFILLISVSVKVFEDDIAKVAIKYVSKSIDAPIEIGSVNFNLVRGFPKASIEFRDLWLKSPDKQDTDTIAGIRHLYVSMNSRAALQGSYEVEKIEIDGLAFNYFINPDSIANINFLMQLATSSDSSTQEANTIDSTTSSTPLHLNLQQLLLKNISCTYYDSTSHTGAKVNVPEIVMKGNIMGDNYTAESNGNISITDVNFGDYKLGLMKEAKLAFHLHYNEDSITINKFTFQAEGIDISAMGLASINDITIDAAIDGGMVDLGIISRYLPDEMMQELGLISTEGILSFETNITGEYSDSIMPRVDAQFSFTDGAIRTIDYPNIKHLSFAGSASNGVFRNNSSTSLNLSSLKVKTEHSSINLAAHISNIDQVDYKINTKGSVLIDEFTEYIPEGTVESISGRLNWEVQTSGTIPKEIDDMFTDYVLARTQANISLDNINTKVDSSLHIENFSGSIQYKANSLQIEKLNIGIPTYDVSIQNTSADIHIDGRVSDIDNIACDIKNLHLESDGNTLDLTASVSNLTNPDYTLNGQVQLNLADLQKFAPDTLINSMSGKINTSIYSAGYIHLDSIESQAEKLAFENTRLSLYCKDVNVDLTDTLLEIADLNIDLNIKPDTITVDSLSGNYKGLTFGVEATQIINAYNAVYLNKKEELRINTSIKIGEVDYALFTPFMANDQEDEDSTVSNFTIDVKGDIAIESFNISDYEVDSTMTIKQLKLEDIASKFRITDSTYIADSLEFNAFGGYMNTSLRYDFMPDGTAVASVRNHIDGMDFTQLLHDMDNFGQNDLTYENISGRLLSDINAEAIIIGDSLPMDMMHMKGTFELRNGGIFDFEAAQELSKFTGIKELDNIRFQTLKTQLFIHKGAAYIPKTDIVSTALDITAFGMQTFGEDYEYYIELHLGDVLTGKSENLLKRQEKAAKDADEEVNRNGINLVVYSLDGKTKNGFDNNKSRRKMNNKITSKNGVLSMFFNPQLVDFDTDK